MSKRVLAIGVGGTGKAALTILKERLEETYGQVPDNVVLLSFDTDDLRAEDSFGGVRLNTQMDERKREPEFRHIVSKPGVTMDTIFADITRERTSSYMYWLEHKKLDLISSPSERDIRGGAQQRRPIGRVAIFQRWDNPIYSSILDAINRIYGEPEDKENENIDNVKMEQSKRVIFIIGSVAGGTGSGFLIDIANLIRHAINSNPKFQSIDLSAIVVLPDAFSSYTTVMNDPTNLKPNSYAALRELDRFIRTHSTRLPYMIRYGENINSVTWSTNQLLDHVYLLDTVSSSGVMNFDLRGNPWRGIFPIISDFVMSHVDESLGDGLATLRSNAGQHYNKEEGWQYSSFNLLTYIFPVEDVIKSFSYRFLREMLTRQFLPIIDKKQSGLIQQEATQEVERVFTENNIGGKVNPGVIQKAIACTRKFDAEKPDVSWRGLLNMIALSDSSFAQDYQDLEGWLQYLLTNMIPTGIGEYKRESYDDGYIRLMNISDTFMDNCLGPKYDSDNEDARLDGEWDRILVRYREALRIRFAEALDVQILDVMNRRDPQNKLLREYRLPFARFMLAALKQKLVAFKEQIKTKYADLRLDERIRQSSHLVREQIAYMQDTKDTKTWALLGKPDARKAQDAYISDFNEKMELMLHQKVYRTIINVLDALGAAERDQDNNLSVLDYAALELENWQMTFQEVDKTLAEGWRMHEKNREQKQNVKVRRYLTDEKFEAELYQREEHVGMVAGRALGQVRGETGIIWRRLNENEPLRIKVVTEWTEEAKGSEQIASKFFNGIRGLFQVIRESVTVADRIRATAVSPASFTSTANMLNEPFLRYNPAVNGKQMFVERYLSYSDANAQDDSRQFFNTVTSSLENQGVNVVSVAESKVACTVLEISRGVQLRAVDQFVSCEQDYRSKLYKGRESLHLFTEEQIASQFEDQIETLGEPTNRIRTFSPNLVVTMGDSNVIRLFTLGWAYGLIYHAANFDAEDGVETTEIFLKTKMSSEPEAALRLSESKVARIIDRRFASMGHEEQVNRLYLNALQHFALIAIEKRGISVRLVTNLADTLKNHGIYFGIENPFTYTARDFGKSLFIAMEELGPDEFEKTDRVEREQINSQRRIEKIEAFINKAIQSCKLSPSPDVRDMGTVMHLILREELNFLRISRSEIVGIPRKIVDPFIIRFLSSISWENIEHTEGDWFEYENTSQLDDSTKIKVKEIEKFCALLQKELGSGISKPRLVKGLWVSEIDVTGFLDDVLFERNVAEVKISPHIPTVFLGWKTFGSNEAKILSVALNEFSPKQNIVIVFWGGKQDEITGIQNQVVSEMRSGYGKEIVILDARNVERILEDKSPRSTLKAAILGQINLSIISPYIISGPVTSDIVFSGREKEISAISYGIHKSNFILIGGRRIGKTTLLRKLETRLPESDFRTVYQDCSIISTYDEFLDSLSLNLFSNRVNFRSQKPHSKLESILASLSIDNRHPVLLLDEADKLLKIDASARSKILNNLRAHSNKGLCHIVLSGEQTLQKEMGDANSTLFHFGQEMIIRGLERDEVKVLVTRPMSRLGIEFSEEQPILDYIWALTGGHPYMIQLICHRLIETQNHRIDLNMVQSITNDPQFVKKDYLNILWEKADSLEKLCSLIMALDSNVNTAILLQEELKKKGMDVPIHRIEEATASLAELRNIIKLTEKGYQFKIAEFPRIVRNVTWVQDAIQSNIEQFLTEESE